LFDCGGELHCAVGLTSGGLPFGIPVAALQGEFGEHYDPDYEPDCNRLEVVR
jgi:hypothetical protein